jgi:hypothetical protein
MDYYGTARTNYFRVKNAQAFKDAVEKISGLSYEIRRVENAAMFGIFTNNQYGWIEEYYDEETDSDVSIDWDKFFKTHLHKDSVAIMRDVGNEEQRYLHGHTIAWNANGDKKIICLDDIYALATELGTVHTRVEW